MCSVLISLVRAARLSMCSRAALQLKILASDISSKFWNGHGLDECA